MATIIKIRMETETNNSKLFVNLIYSFLLLSICHCLYDKIDIHTVTIKGGNSSKANLNWVIFPVEISPNLKAPSSNKKIKKLRPNIAKVFFPCPNKIFIYHQAIPPSNRFTAPPPFKPIPLFPLKLPYRPPCST